jgi:hypothetical protein
MSVHCIQGWPEPYVKTVYDLMFGDLPLPKIPYPHRIYIWFRPTLLAYRVTVCHCVTSLMLASVNTFAHVRLQESQLYSFV